MAVHRYTVAVWRDLAGFYTACWVEERERHAAVSKDRGDAVKQLRDYLRWLHEEEPWTCPDFEEASILWIAVDLRPEYRVDDRVYPVSEPTRLRVPCVLGRRREGLLVCSIPTLSVQFNYYDAGGLKELVQHYVQNRLEGLTPAQLYRHLPPPEISLAEVSIRHEDGDGSTASPRDPQTLASVAHRLVGRRAPGRPSRCWEREDEVADLTRRLTEEKANLLLLGEPGVGKTAVLVDAVRRLDRESRGNEPQKRPERRFWSTNASRLIAGMRYLGQWEERCEQIIEELTEIEGVLCIESLIDLLRLGGRGAVDSLAAFFLPYLERSELRVVAETTPSELDASRRLLPGFADVFQVLRIEPFPRSQAIQVLKRHAASLEQNLGVRTGERVPESVYRLFSRFQPYRPFPGSSVLFLSNLYDQSRRDDQRSVECEDVTLLFLRQTGLPEALLDDDRKLALEDIRQALETKVLGQEGACAASADFIVTFKAGLNDPGRPLGVLLFCGPTGVGKTELARSIAEFLFGGGGDASKRLVRLDMSEYSGPLAARRLLGDGGESGGESSQLIKQVRQQPFCVVLLDEIEKADPKVLDMLLGLFDEGHLTDRFGRVTNFQSSVVILTSNIGAENQEPLGFAQESPRTFDAEVRSFFRPELYNRFDAVVTFNPLEPETIDRITLKELTEIAGREGFAANNLRLTWSDALVQFLSERGFDRRYGARPLQRTIEQLVTTPLSEFLLDNAGIRNAEIRLEVDENGQVTVELV